ncbi:unnamed protein product [Dicrocoelium dendriticum]|nr:unnamed protein product [Dicrocoelium dendriticum]
MSSPGIISQLKQSKDPTVFRELNQYVKFSTKLAVARASVQFFDECILRCEYPKHFWKILRRNGINPTNTALKRHTLNERDTIVSRINELELKRCVFSVALENLSAEEYQTFESYVQRIVARQVEVRLSSLQKQLNVGKPQNLFPPDPERYVHNFSSVPLDKVLLEALSLGPKFCCPRNYVKQLDLEVQFENLYSQVATLSPSSALAAEQYKSTLVNACYEYLTYKPCTKHLLKQEHLDALKELKRNDKILLSRPDKGAGIVLMDRSDYISKMYAILSDGTKFRRVDNENDKTQAIERSITKLLRCLKQENVIDSDIFEYTRPSGTVIPRLYGLPKVHKEGLPLRPILDMCNSPYHSTAKWLVKRLEPVRKAIARYSLKDTFDFLDSVRQIELAGRQMFSLDVVSLFTNVPLEETIDYLCEFILLRNINVGIPLDRLRQLLLMCTRNIQFQFNGTLYRQIDGVAMGSPLGPLLADVFMSKLECNQLNESINSLVYYGRYVDDIFCIANNGMCVDDLLAQFNTAHSNITFTIELERNDTLAFLDVQIKRASDGSMRRRVHRKATWNGQYIHFASFVPISQKRNLVRCLTERARRICTDDTLSDELSFIRNVLERNGYPEKFIQRHMEPRVQKPKPVSVEKRMVYLSLPFKGDAIAERTTRRLSLATEKTYFAANLRVSFTSTPLVCQQLKDRIPRSQTSFCVYNFSCSCRARYIGKTTRRLSIRAREHCPAWLYSGVRKNITSAVLSHLVDSDHQIDSRDAFTPIYCVPGRFTRAVRCRLLSTAEAIAIRLHNPDLCAQKKLVHTLALPWPEINATNNGSHANSLDQSDQTRRLID